MYSLCSIKDNIIRIFKNYINLCIVSLRNELGYYNSKADLNQTESEN